MLKIIGVFVAFLAAIFFLKPYAQEIATDAVLNKNAKQENLEKDSLRATSPVPSLRVKEANKEEPPKQKPLTVQKNRASVVVEKIVLSPSLPVLSSPVAPPSPVIPVSPDIRVLPQASTTMFASEPLEQKPPSPSPLPPLDDTALLRAVVKIECPTADGLGKYIGSGFVAGEGVIITAAHVVKDSLREECAVIFPRERRPIHYLKGTIDDMTEVKKRHDEQGIDVAVLRLPPIELYDDARSIFPKGYPRVPYPICVNPTMLGDTLLHFGYPSNFVDQNYLMESKGEAVLYADINGIKDQISSEGGSTYKTPIFGYTNNESVMHPYMVSRVPTFYGDSGGLAFNATKQCMLGPHRGGTMGGGEGENYSVFPLLGVEGVSAFLKRYGLP